MLFEVSTKSYLPLLTKHGQKVNLLHFPILFEPDISKELMSHLNFAHYLLLKPKYHISTGSPITEGLMFAFSKNVQNGIRIGVQVEKMKMDFNTGGTRRRVGQ